VLRRIAIYGLSGCGESILIRILRRHPQLSVATRGGAHAVDQDRSVDRDRSVHSCRTASDGEPWPATQPLYVDVLKVELSEFAIDAGPADANRADTGPTPAVLLVRHPLDWAAAMRRSGNASLSCLVDAWSRYYSAPDNQLAGTAEPIIVRFEDLVSSPAATLTRLFARLNLTPVPLPRLIPAVLKAELDRCRKVLIAAAKNRPGEVFSLDRDLLRRFRYKSTAPRRPTAPKPVADRADRAVRLRPRVELATPRKNTKSVVVRKATKPPAVSSRTVSKRAKPVRPHRSPERRVPVPGEPLRVGLLTPSLGVGGAERWMISLARHADPRRIQWVGTALTYASQADPALAAEMARIMPIYSEAASAAEWVGNAVPGVPSVDPNSPIHRFRTPREAIAAVANAADVVISWGSSRSGFVARRFGCRTVFVSHCSFGSADCLASAVDSQINLTAVSEAATATFPDYLRSRVRVIHNGIDEHRSVATRPRAEIRQEWGFEDHHRLVGYVGRASHEKNPLAAAQAVAHLGGDYRAVYVGPGRHLEEVRAAALEIAGPNVLFVPPVDQIGNALAALDAFVLASPSEGFSLALTEAWYAGLPTVATRVGAVPELETKHGQLVVPVPINPTPDELARAVEQALSDDNRETVNRAREVVREQYTATAMAARWCDYLDEIVRQSSPLAPRGEPEQSNPVASQSDIRPTLLTS